MKTATVPGLEGIGDGEDLTPLIIGDLRPPNAELSALGSSKSLSMMLDISSSSSSSEKEIKVIILLLCLVSEL